MANMASHVRSEVVGHEHFLEEADQRERRSAVDLIDVEFTRLRYLRDQAGGTLDGSCNQLREVRHVDGEVHEIGNRRVVFAVHIDRVRERLKGIERNANRQDDLQRGHVGLHACGSEHLDKTVKKEVEVFEDAEQAEIGDEAQGHPALARSRGPYSRVSSARRQSRPRSTAGSGTGTASPRTRRNT